MTEAETILTSPRMRLSFVSFFAGIGGIDLGLELAGHTCIGQVENNPDCTEILTRHWPDAWRHDDITTLDPTTIPPADLWAGGFPCQDLSAAGKQRGLDGDRSGLWYEWLRLIRASGPPKIVIENIYSRWRAWVPAVRRDLWAAGYASVCIRMRACEVGFPHERARGFVVAYPVCERLQDGWRQQPKAEGRRHTEIEIARVGAGIPADPDGLRELQQEGGVTKFGGRHHHGDAPDGREIPPDAGMVRAIHGLPAGPHPTRSEAQARAARIKALGNAVVPACAEVIGWILAGMESFEK